MLNFLKKVKNETKLQRTNVADFFDFHYDSVFRSELEELKAIPTVDNRDFHKVAMAIKTIAAMMKPLPENIKCEKNVFLDFAIEIGPFVLKYQVNDQGSYKIVLSPRNDERVVLGETERVESVKYQTDASVDSERQHSPFRNELLFSFRSKIEEKDLPIELRGGEVYYVGDLTLLKETMEEMKGTVLQKGYEFSFWNAEKIEPYMEPFVRQFEQTAKGLIKLEKKAEKERIALLQEKEKKKKEIEEREKASLREFYK